MWGKIGAGDRDKTKRGARTGTKNGDKNDGIVLRRQSDCALSLLQYGELNRVQLEWMEIRCASAVFGNGLPARPRFGMIRKSVGFI